MPITLFYFDLICVWEGIFYDDRTNLLILINQTMTALKYRDMVLSFVHSCFCIQYRNEGTLYCRVFFIRHIFLKSHFFTEN